MSLSFENANPIHTEFMSRPEMILEVTSNVVKFPLFVHLISNKQFLAQVFGKFSDFELQLMTDKKRTNNKNILILIFNSPCFCLRS